MTWELVLRKWRPYLRVFRTFILIFILVSYSVAGGFLFQYVENLNNYQLLSENLTESDQQSNFTELIINQLIEVHENCSTFHLNTNECKQLFADIVSQLELHAEFTGSDRNWSLVEAILYSGTLYTTIGYGHLSCKSFFGRLTTIIYATAGIPLLFLLISDIGRLVYVYTVRTWLRLKNTIRPVWNKVFHTKISLRPSLASIGTEHHNPEEEITVLLALIIQFSFCAVVALFFWQIEQDWDFFSAFYFVFISFTTIGLGDLVPSDPKYVVFGFICFIIGLSLISVSINAIHTYYRRLYTKLLRKLENVTLRCSGDSYYSHEINRKKTRVYYSSADLRSDSPSLAHDANRNVVVPVEASPSKVNPEIHMGVFQVDARRSRKLSAVEDGDSDSNDEEYNHHDEDSGYHHTQETCDNCRYDVSELNRFTITTIDERECQCVNPSCV